jgi:enamine deaminase RidA (YjgF/YER057c/UK114 family)
MERRVVNPWSWQDGFGFSQAVEITAGQRVLYCAGQASVDADGRPMHPGDIVAQLNQALNNLDTVSNRLASQFRTSCGSITTRPTSMGF